MDCLDQAQCEAHHRAAKHVRPPRSRSIPCKALCTQHGVLTFILSSDKPSEMEGFPMKSWNIEIYLLDDAGEEKPANCFTKAVYNLHPSFKNPVQSESSTRCEVQLHCVLTCAFS